MQLKQIPPRAGNRKHWIGLDWISGVRQTFIFFRIEKSIPIPNSKISEFEIQFQIRNALRIIQKFQILYLIKISDIFRK